MEKKIKKKNSIMELMRFLFSIMVVGYHTRDAFVYGSNPLFSGRYLVVEFFFVLSGFLMAGSIERENSRDKTVGVRETAVFLWKKVKAILPLHIAANMLMIVVIAVNDIGTLDHRVFQGLAGLFLAQMLIVWKGTVGLTEPEWYLLSMFVVMAFFILCAGC